LGEAWTGLIWRPSRFCRLTDRRPTGLGEVGGKAALRALFSHVPLSLSNNAVGDDYVGGAFTSLSGRASGLGQVDVPPRICKVRLCPGAEAVEEAKILHVCA